MLLRRLETEPSRDLSANVAGPKSTLSQDAYAGQRFHYCLSNPPFGKKWEKDQAFVEREAKEKGFEGRFGAGTPRVSDGSMLFIQHLISKLEHPNKGGGRAAIILSGSPCSPAPQVVMAIASRRSAGGCSRRTTSKPLSPCQTTSSSVPVSVLTSGC